MINGIHLFAVVLTCALPFASNGQQTDSPEFLSPEFQFLWESDNKLEIPESVLYDEENTCLYVSNINGAPSKQDGNGYISKLNTKGGILTLKWISGLDAPKGMAKNGNLLYVSDINDLVVIDIEKAKIIKKYPADDALFLNDVEMNPKTGTVYVSDSQSKTIYHLKDGVFSPWITDDELKNVNGLCFKNSRLYVGVHNKIVSIEPESKSITAIATDTGNIDGLINIDNNNWIISDWVGTIQLVSSGKVNKILCRAKQKINAADLGYIPDQKIVLVPTFFNNRVVAYQLK